MLFLMRTELVQFVDLLPPTYSDNSAARFAEDITKCHARSRWIQAYCIVDLPAIHQPLTPMLEWSEKLTASKTAFGRCMSSRS